MSEISIIEKEMPTLVFKNKENEEKKSKKLPLILIIFLSLVLTGGIIAIIITGTIPCSYTKCHERASCFNRPFYGECVCNYGYNGNGRDHCDECGLTFFKHNANDMGLKAVPYSWPATALIEFMYTTLERFEAKTILINEIDSCGGVLINRKTILTAAHCIKRSFQYYDWSNRKEFTINVNLNNFNPTIESIYSVYLGTDTYPYFNTDLPRVLLANFNEIIVHENFDPKTLENNIAIIKLTDTINLDRYIQIACLPNQTSNSIPMIEHKHAYVAGYSSAGDSWSTWSLRNSRMDLFNNSMCDEVHPEKTKNWNSQFCAGEYDEFSNETGNCHGDYGSALYTIEKVNEKNKFIATGILSHDLPCRTDHAPAIFTRISYYLDWIKKNSNY